MTTDTPRTDDYQNAIERLEEQLTHFDDVHCKCVPRLKAEIAFWKAKAYESEQSEGRHEAEVERLKALPNCHHNWMTTYKPTINYPLTTRDLRGNVTHIKYSDGSEAWKKYDENNNIRHYKDSDGHEYLFDSEGNEISNES